jgi:hypothetical protein
MTTVCQAVSRLEKTRERYCAPTGPCLSPLSQRVCQPSFASNSLLFGLGLLEKVERPEGYNSEHLEAPRFGRRPSKDVVNHRLCRRGVAA